MYNIHLIVNFYEVASLVFLVDYVGRFWISWQLSYAKKNWPMLTLREPKSKRLRYMYVSIQWARRESEYKQECSCQLAGNAAREKTSRDAEKKIALSDLLPKLLGTEPDRKQRRKKSTLADLLAMVQGREPGEPKEEESALAGLLVILQRKGLDGEQGQKKCVLIESLSMLRDKEPMLWFVWLYISINSSQCVFVQEMNQLHWKGHRLPYSQHGLISTAMIKLHTSGCTHRFPTNHYVHQKVSRRWTPRKCGGANVIGEMNYVSPCDTEHFHLCLFPCMSVLSPVIETWGPLLAWRQRRSKQRVGISTCSRRTMSGTTVLQNLWAFKCELSFAISLPPFTSFVHLQTPSAVARSQIGHDRGLFQGWYCWECRKLVLLDIEYLLSVHDFFCVAHHLSSPVPWNQVPDLLGKESEGGISCLDWHCSSTAFWKQDPP